MPLVVDDGSMSVLVSNDVSNAIQGKYKFISKTYLQIYKFIV
jgi:hypothetical protein